MKDSRQLRDAILTKYYEHRRGPFMIPKPEDFDPPIAEEDILEISDQLHQERLLIEWKVIKTIFSGLGKISALGIDDVEGKAALHHRRGEFAQPMKDSQLRGTILAKYYEHQSGSLMRPKPSDFDPPIAEEDILEISDQLHQGGLIQWVVTKGNDGKILSGLGKIKKSGTEVVDGEATPYIRVDFA